ncbi:hypothetical protein [Photobacterium angustum]|uniref:Uncharacterized protein n=1 Tax=Photobacterium angustum TaxID=661 RepID=A0A2S7VI49_PHOAN|nr:hypothetical protein [Photobacterium angustum]PQJ61844.1 hypothetical protein BTO08_16375 [Photobacterium angustum]
MKKLLLAIFPFLLFSAPSFAYTRYAVLNSTPGTIQSLTFREKSSFCNPHLLTHIGPWSLKIDPSRRGVCLVKKITGTLRMDDGTTIPLNYKSVGASYGQYIIIATRVNNKWYAKITPGDV